MNEKTKKIMIDAPENMSVEQAQQCFVVGLKMHLTAYRGGVTVNYATKDNVVNVSFYGRETGAVIDFINAIKQNKSENWTEKKEDLENKGSEILGKM